MKKQKTKSVRHFPSRKDILWSKHEFGGNRVRLGSNQAARETNRAECRFDDAGRVRNPGRGGAASVERALRQLWGVRATGASHHVSWRAFVFLSFTAATHTGSRERET